MFEIIQAMEKLHIGREKIMIDARERMYHERRSLSEKRKERKLFYREMRKRIKRKRNLA